MIDYSKILSRKYKGSEWTLNGEDYAGLTWLSDTPKPTKSTLDGLWSEVVAEIEAEESSKSAARKAVLDKLGVTAEEAVLLLG
jgi:hypothetical protein